MMKRTDVDVLIVGAGPVGLTLALDLAWRGIDVTVIEQRPRGAAPEPKCNHVSARTMEIFRRLGIADRIRGAGLPADYPHDISYRTTFTGQELTRIEIPCRAERFTRRDGPDSGWPTPEPPHRINQIYLEPILFGFALEHTRITILNRTSAESICVGDDDANVQIRDLESGATRVLTARFLIGCDGARSVVRKAIGSELHGDAVIQRVQSTFIRAPGLIDLQDVERAWGTGVINPRRSGMVYAIDGHECWLVHNYLQPDEADFESVDRDLCIRTILGVNSGFSYEVISKEDWYGRRLVANRFRDRCAFIAGDAAHIWVPYAGYGMNAGIADATNLSWLLAAHLNGWAPMGILDAYEAERLPITNQVSKFAMAHAAREIKRRGAIPANIEDMNAAGAQTRREIGQLTYEINVQQYAAAGLNFGSFYDASPIIAYDGGKQPDYTMSTFTPSTVPGCRTPHIFLADGRSLYDLLGAEFTLLRSTPGVDVEPLLAAARQLRVPMRLVDIEGPEAFKIYDFSFVISRPDQHIAWRGDDLPVSPCDLIDLLRGGVETANSLRRV